MNFMNRLSVLFVCIFAGYGVYMFSEQTISITSGNIRVEGVVTKLDKHISYSHKTKRNSTSYTPVFSYQVNGQDYSSPAFPPVFKFSGSSSHQIGEKAFLYINPENHQQFVIDSFSEKWFDSLASLAICLIFFVFGIIRPKPKQNLGPKYEDIPIPTGPNTINAVVLGVRQVPSLTMNNKLCYVIEAEDKKSGIRYSSQQLQDYPFEYRAGSIVQVKIDPVNPMKYSMVLLDLKSVA